MATFQLDIVTPEKTIYSGDVEQVQAPGADGGFGVLARHQPMLAALAIGQVVFTQADGTNHKLAVSGGFANVSGDGMTVLAETAEMAQEIDIERARVARDRARSRLSDRGQVDMDRAQAALSRATWRLRTCGAE
ncbi:MAG: F0F1 ATP synthase subunit epsilon [Candidatus Latescibacteria bacterium]|nr:F0F1 ATP synthase subunit epsilon [Candidatus Latescibacterota bacterium]MBT4139755.1 F0F1 ATP synthase subunit epsilon [Candidatus Latescibacterota bacterium]